MAHPPVELERCGLAREMVVGGGLVIHSLEADLRDQ
jgi:hypothetical protein